MKATKILVLGVTGMLGHKLLLQLSKNNNHDVHATARQPDQLSRWFSPELLRKIQCDVDADRFESVKGAIESVQPDIVINCIGLIKQLPLASDPLSSITINAELPHRLSIVCRTVEARLIHISTDCVFDGAKGHYTENDQSNASDLYGRSKYLGEVNYPHCITLRTSIIGHELKGKRGLIEWFLGQDAKVRGYTNAIYTGFPTVELAHIIDRYVIPSDKLSGLYHVSSEPISKYELLRLVMKRYGKSIEIEPFADVRSDRSLDSSSFRTTTGYLPPSWVELVDRMHQDFVRSQYYERHAE